MTPLFKRIELLIGRLDGFTEDEAEMLCMAVTEFATFDPDPEGDDVGTDGRDLVFHARDACKAAGIDIEY